MSTQTNNVFNALDLIRFAWDKKWMLIIATLLAFIGSIIISLQLTDRFRSSVVLFPAASVSISKSLVETSSISMDSRDILSFGREEDAERMLQILHSNQIKDYIINKYKLIEHYDIDLNGKFPYTKLDKKYKSNISYRRTKYMSIEISVLDEDPEYAANIANDISAYIDSTIHNMQKQRAMEAFKIVEKEYRASQMEIENLNDSIRKIRELGIYDYETQASAFNEAYAKAISSGNRTLQRSIEQKLALLAEYGGDYVQLSKKIESEIERLGQLKDKYAAAKINVEQTVPQIFIVDEAKVSERKALPKRSNIVMACTASTFALTLLLLLIIDGLKAKK